ncbi:MAG TPA: AMP-binding protein [Longimicrobiales bacterium]|nr:AMP-binding protein [Longimicrobiales bacterium]
MFREPEADYEALRRGFHWRLPGAFNMGSACLRGGGPDAVALLVRRAEGETETLTFGDLDRRSAALANVLKGGGVGPGDRVAICLPQGAEAAFAYLAAFRMGAVAVPVSGLFGPDAIRYRLGHSEAAAMVTDASGAGKVGEVRGDLEALRLLLVAGEDDPPDAVGLQEALAAASDAFEDRRTRAEDPALLVYTSGTTGEPKGTLHAHRYLFGAFPAVELAHWPLPSDGDLFWTPADWSWVAALMDVVLPAWYFGTPVLATPRTEFDPGWAFRVMSEQSVANAYLPPTALKMLRGAGDPTARPSLRSVMTGGEVLGAEMLAWAEGVLGVTVEETYGQTEANLTVGNASRFWPVRPGSMGLPYPGHDVAIQREDGSEADPGEMGEIAVRRPDPAMFLRYLDAPEQTEEVFRGDWLRSGDLAHRDDEGYLWFEGRRDDLINVAGHRIGPAEIEESLIGHPAVGMAGVIGIPDEERGQAIKAFVVLAEGARGSDQLEAELREHVRRRLGAHLYPRTFEFLDELPLTVSGKIRRRDLREREGSL